MKDELKTTNKLKEKAQIVFNAWIRRRDAGQPCIACGEFKQLQAGHFYSAGKFNHLRFNEDNAHGECLPCNYFLSGNLLPYRENLIKKIGQERFDTLSLLAQSRVTTKNDRFLYLEIISKYKTT